LGDAVRLVDSAGSDERTRVRRPIGEDFKLGNGTWVSVGPLRARSSARWRPSLQDVVIAGLDAEFVTVLVIPDVNACATMFASAGTPTCAELAGDARLVAWLRRQLGAHARANPASSRCVRRARILPVTPSLDRGEITDKGSINQRAVLRHHAELVAELYAEVPPAQVAVSRSTRHPTADICNWRRSTDAR
jgi:feruloyl-CoA synthase